eukprot:3290362-Pyramimonas_sp.AAC.1
MGVRNASFARFAVERNRCIPARLTHPKCQYCATDHIRSAVLCGRLNCDRNIVWIAIQRDSNAARLPSAIQEQLFGEFILAEPGNHTSVFVIFYSV